MALKGQKFLNNCKIFDNLENALNHLFLHICFTMFLWDTQSLIFLGSSSVVKYLFHEESFKAVNDELNEIYSEKDDEVVILKDDDKQRVYELLAKFASKCRSDLEIGDEVQDQFIKTTVATITSTGKKKRDYTKYSFNGKEYPKNQYVYHVIKTFFDENPDISLEDFPKRVIERTPIEFDGDRKNDYETWKTYYQAIEVYQRTGKKRYFVTKRGGDYLKDKDLVLKLADAEICISNQWGLPNMEIFKEIMNSKGIRTE